MVFPCYCPVRPSEASEGTDINDGLGQTWSFGEAGRLGFSGKLGESSQGVPYSELFRVGDMKTKRDEDSVKISFPFFLSPTSTSNQACVFRSETFLPGISLFPSHILHPNATVSTPFSATVSCVPSWP